MRKKIGEAINKNCDNSVTPKKYILETTYGDIWKYDDLDEAKRDQYIFGGTITSVTV